MNRTLYRWFRMGVIQIPAYVLAVRLSHDAVVGLSASALLGTLLSWIEEIFAKRNPAPDPTLCDCGGGREGPHRGNCRLIRAWEPYTRGAPR